MMLSAAVYRDGGGSSGRNKVSQTQDIYWSQTICFMRTLTILRQYSIGRHAALVGNKYLVKLL